MIIFAESLECFLVFQNVLFQSCLHLVSICRQLKFNALALVDVLCVSWLNQIYREAGIDGASSHSGRRSFITKLASKGVSARVLQQLAGHSSLATTQRYIDVTDKMLQEAVELA